MARKSKASERVGQKFINKQGSRFVIVVYNKRSDVYVQFLDEHGAIVHTTYQHCVNGQVKNPYDKILYGVGYLGEGDFKTRIDGKLTREYNVWKDILRRCYGGEEQYRTYENVEVIERWHCYANFLEDLPLIENYQWWLENPNQHISLDKDLKQQGVENKIYSLETVIFISASDNTKEIHNRNKESLNNDSF